MLRQYLNDKTIREVPYAYGQYTASIEGKLFKDNGEIEIVPDSEGMVEIAIIGKIRKVNIDWVMAITFKPMYDAMSFVLNWKVLRYSGKEELSYLESLIWYPPVGGQPCLDLPDFNVIPGYSTYSISKNGVIWNRATKTYIKSRASNPTEENSYINFSVFLDGSGKYGSILGVHRAIALAWKQYTYNVLDLTVNHLNGRKRDNTFDNVEWASYSENNIHALDNGLRFARKEVYVKDYLTGAIKLYSSLTRAAKAIGVGTGHLRTDIVVYPNKLIKKRYYVIYADQPLNWPNISMEDVKQNLKKDAEHKSSLFCCGFNAITGVKYIAQSPSDLRVYTKLGKEEQRTSLSSKSKWPYKGWYCWWSADVKEVYKIPPEIAEQLKDFKVFKNPLIERLGNGDCKVYLDYNHVREEELSLGTSNTSNGKRNLVEYCPTETIVLSL